MLRMLLLGLVTAVGSPLDASTPQENRAQQRPPQTPSNATADRQMLTLDRRARVDMILYTGRFDRGDMASTRKADAPRPFAKLFQQPPVGVDSVRPSQPLPPGKHQTGPRGLAPVPSRQPRVFQENYGPQARIQGPKVVCGLKVWQVDPAIDSQIRIESPPGDFKIQRIDPPACPEEAR
jgi:hypothetical protein